MTSSPYNFTNQSYNNFLGDHVQSFTPPLTNNYQPIPRPHSQPQYSNYSSQIQHPFPKNPYMQSQHSFEPKMNMTNRIDEPSMQGNHSMMMPSYVTPPLSEFGMQQMRSGGKVNSNAYSSSSGQQQPILHTPSPRQQLLTQHQISSNSSSSSQPKQQDPFHLNLETYKSQPCTIKKVHNHKQCHYFHHEKDRKRVGFSYSADICEFIEQNKECPFADDCNNSHNKVEQLFRPDKYKKKFCVHYPHNLSKCEYGMFCSFAHSENDIKIDLIHHYVQNDEFFMYHFKTVWCPFNYINHDKGGCVYAHNWQDYRRRPDQYNYEPIPCTNWKPTEIVQNYEKGCPEGLYCQKCHGWKEYDFFPQIYKTRACDNGKKCIKGNCCPFYHHPESRRLKNTMKPLLNNAVNADLKDIITFSGNFDDELRNLEDNCSTKSTLKEIVTYSGMSFKEDMEKIPRNDRRFSFEKESVGEHKKYAMANEKITDDLFKEILEEASERPKSRTMPVKSFSSQPVQQPQPHLPLHHLMTNQQKLTQATNLQMFARKY